MTEIEKREKIWAAASIPERKVLMAKDVLLQLRKKKISVERGSWINFYVGHDIGNVRDYVLSEDSVSCSCCAVGSLLLSCTLFKNNVVLRKNQFFLDYHRFDFEETKIANEQLLEVFSHEELKEIEQYFELGRGCFSCPNGFSELWLNYEPEKRLILIMKNIIRNKGQFIPSKRWKD